MNNAASYSEEGESPKRPSCFYMGGDGGPGNLVTITGDVWHHILICYDLSTPCSAEYFNDADPETPAVVFYPGPTFQWVLDDISQNGDAMFPSGSPLGEEDEDFLVHIYPSSISTGATPSADFGDSVLATWASTPIATDGNPIGIPSSGDFSTSIYNIRVCEVQIFTDVTLDLTVDESRRAFIKSNGRPAHQSLAADLLGKEPEVYFRTVADWQAGNNLGTAGSFTPTGTILETDGP